MLNERQKRDLFLLLINMSIVIANTLWFRWLWYKYYFGRIRTPFVTLGNYAVIAIFLVLYISFAKLYGGFDLKTSRTSELVYSHVIASVMTGLTMLIVLLLLIYHIPPIMPMLFPGMTEKLKSSSTGSPEP